MHLLKHAPTSDVHVSDRPLDDDETLSGIRCPLCGWRPSASSRWSCISLGTPEQFFAGCGTVWNTFATGGRCPGCQHQWRWTSCLRCEEWSLHVDWYEPPDGGDPDRI
jgi:hypothetical protein